MKKSISILTILMTIYSLSPFIGMAQTVVETSGQPQKKEHKVKVVINEDGKLVEKEMTTMADSIYNSTEDGLKSKKVTVTIRDDGSSGGKVSTYTYTIGDTLQNDVTRKMIRTGDGKHMIIMQSGDSANFDLPAPPPSSREHRVVGYPLRDPYARAYRTFDYPLRDPFAFDPTDTTIVSYNKKDIGKGEEKITIVRKKVVQSN